MHKKILRIKKRKGGFIGAILGSLASTLIPSAIKGIGSLFTRRKGKGYSHKKETKHLQRYKYKF